MLMIDSLSLVMGGYVAQMPFLEQGRREIVGVNFPSVHAVLYFIAVIPYLSWISENKSVCCMYSMLYIQF